MRRPEGAHCHEKKSVSTTGTKGEQAMAESVYKIVELVGTSSESWEKAAAAAVNQAAKSLRDLRIVEVKQLDMQVANGKVRAYRARVNVSFKFESKKEK
jgi:dodecin